MYDPRTSRLQESVTLQNETRETGPDRPESAAVVNARQRVAAIAGSNGVRSPEYATGLNQLALLLIMQGEPEAAEPLLKQALEVRRTTLGELHPDVATNLSSLGGLVWARGDLDQAEPLLRQALDVRLQTLGPSDPKSAVSLKSLEQLRKAMADRDVVDRIEPVSTVTPSDPPLLSLIEGVDSPATQAHENAPGEPCPMGSLVSEPQDGGEHVGCEAINAGLEKIYVEFVGLAERLALAGERLLSGFLPPEDDLERAWTVAREAFTQLCRDVTDAVRAGSLPEPPRGFASLEDISAVLPSLREAEDARAVARSARRDALSILDRVAQLICPADPTFEPLAICQAQALALRRALESTRPGELSEEASALNGGTHPLSVLLRLLAADEATGDAQWADWYDTVAAAFGNAMAVASARSRITPTGA